MVKERSAVPLLFLAWTRLGRLASRFDALVAAVRAGRLPAGPESRAQSAADLELPRLEGLPQPFRLPGRFGWLVRLVPGAAVYGSQMQHVLADPEMAALLAAPQAGRMLRPLCRMLAIRLGPELRRTRREGSASPAGPAESEGQPDSSVTRGDPSGSRAGSEPRPHRARAMGTRSARGLTRRWPGLRAPERAGLRARCSAIKTLCLSAVFRGAAMRAAGAHSPVF
ncbi:MAG: hypothetical protein JOY71_11620 [Acetobacteraceae bacterium]|nr:hypothetical protein [Acetobacteraceae bacterium]